MMKTFTLFAVLTVFLISSLAFAVEIEKDLFYSQEDYAIGDNVRNPGKIGPIALGDVNGDGFDDLVMGAPQAIALDQRDTGVVYIRFGLNFGPWDGYVNESWFDLSTTYTQTSDPTSSAVNFPDGHGRLGGAQINGEVIRGRFGTTVACGDFDGDGIDDIAISMGENISPAGTGRVYVIKGGPELSGTIDLSEARFLSRSFYITGRRDGDRFGEKLFFTDFNNDGKKDLVIGTPRGGDGGEVDVFYGRDFAPFYYQNVDSLPQPHTIFISERPNDFLGFSFADGDFTGNGLIDLAIGAPRHSLFANHAGAVYLFEGTSDLVFQRGMIDLGETTRTLKIISRTSEEQAGYSIAGGDLNNDGLSDLAIGAPTWGLNLSRNRGCVYVLFNEAGRFCITGSNLIEIAQNETRFVSLFDETLLGSDIAFVDLDRQYAPELVISAPDASPNARNLAGEAWIVQTGSPTQRFDEVMYYVQHYPRGVHIKGQESGDFFGSWIAVGDFNGDSYQDVFFSGDKGVNSDQKSVWGLFGAPQYRKTGANFLPWQYYE